MGFQGFDADEPLFAVCLWEFLDFCGFGASSLRRLGIQGFRLLQGLGVYLGIGILRKPQEEEVEE